MDHMQGLPSPSARGQPIVPAKHTFVEAPPHTHTASSSKPPPREELEARSAQVFAALTSDMISTQAALEDAKRLFDRLIHKHGSDGTACALLASLLDLLQAFDSNLKRSTLNMQSCVSRIRSFFDIIAEGSGELKPISDLREGIPLLFASEDPEPPTWFRQERADLKFRQLHRKFKQSIDSKPLCPPATVAIHRRKSKQSAYYHPFAVELPVGNAHASTRTVGRRSRRLGRHLHDILECLRPEVTEYNLDDDELMDALDPLVNMVQNSLLRIGTPVIGRTVDQQLYNISALPALQAEYLRCLEVPANLNIMTTGNSVSLPEHAACLLLDSLHEAAKPSILPPPTVSWSQFPSIYTTFPGLPASAHSNTSNHAGIYRAVQVMRTNIRDLLVRLSFECRRFPSSLVLDGVTRLDVHAAAGGAHADVYRGTKDSIIVALKRLRAFAAEQRDRIRLRFYREVILWQYLDHPHILRFFGLDDQLFPPHLCMVSPWMENGSLLEYTLRSSLSTPEVNCLLHQTADGLEYLHEQRLIHGDLRCANILVNEKGKACLADFGLTTLVLESGIATGTSSVGSPRWSAPELFTAEPPLRTEATDIYAFGCVCLELHTRQIPFADITGEHRVIYLLMTGKQLERPSRERYPEADTSDSLWNVLEMCWSLDAASRPSLRTIKAALISQTNEPLEQHSTNHQSANNDLVEQSVVGPRERTEDSIVDSSLENGTVHKRRRLG